MTALRLVPYRKLARVAEGAGFQWVRRESSHSTFRNSEGRIIVIPDHGSHPIVRSLLRKIVRDMGLSIGEYHRILDGL